MSADEQRAAEAWREELRTHQHTFLTTPGRCLICGISDVEARAAKRDAMLTEAFNRLAAVLEKVEAKL